jgi:hypothetical protein
MYKTKTAIKTEAVREARNMECLPRKASGKEWN